MKKIRTILTQWPMVSFLVVLVLLFLIIFLGNTARTPETEEKEVSVPAKRITVLETFDTQYVDASGQVEKNDIVTITATTSGIVHTLRAQTGQQVRAGASLVTLSETYGGGNSAAITSRIAQRQLQNQNETFDKNISIADDQRDDVKKTNDVAAEVARKQFTIQKRNLERDRDLARLEQQRAAQDAARFYPTAPFAGTVDRVFVQKGETVNTGDPLLVLRGDGANTKVTVTVGAAIAKAVSVTEPARIALADGSTISMLPSYISSAPTDAQAFSITFIIEGETEALLHNDFVRVALPLERTQGSARLVPLDAVQLTHDRAIIFVAEDDRARSREVSLGEVLGGSVFVTDGLQKDDTVIVSRTVFDGDVIEIEE